MDAKALSAVNAYKSALNRLEGASGGADGTPEATDSSSFSQLMEKTARDLIDTQYQAEAVGMDALTSGKVEIGDLVTAVANAELTLSTVVAVRDRVISAYQDILRMPI